MKKNKILYILSMVVGAFCMGFGDAYVRKEYALAFGIVLLMYGVYKASHSWKSTDQETKEE